jgi:hypothetical protein
MKQQGAGNLQTLEIRDEKEVSGAWMAGANIGRLDILKMMRKERPSENISQPLVDDDSYIWPDPNLESIKVDFAKAGKGIRINIPIETLQDWL